MLESQRPISTLLFPSIANIQIILSHHRPSSLDETLCVSHIFAFPFTRFPKSSLGLLRVPLGLARPLLEEESLAIVQRRGLSVVDALEPVSEAGAAEGVHGVGPEGALVEEGSHLDADLPEAHGEAL